jgi:outer membrane protein
VTFVQERAKLQTEVTEAYFGLLQLTLEEEMAVDNLRSASLTAGTDSLKLTDGVIAEEDWLESASLALDAELTLFDIQNQKKEQTRGLTGLLDLDPSQELSLAIPSVADHLTSERRDEVIRQWQACLTVKKAEHEYAKAQRSADYAASGHGLNGDLTAKYSFGRSNISDNFGDRNLETGSWGISLNLTYPIWDGGASGAAVQAARLEEEKARLEYESTVKAARAEIINLVNRIDVGYRKLEVLKKQIEMTRSRMDIAKFRFEDGQISEGTYLESKVAFLTARNKYLEELKNYLLDRIELAGKYSN